MKMKNNCVTENNHENNHNKTHSIGSIGAKTPINTTKNRNKIIVVSIITCF